jgi:hypothetical protein
LKEYYDALQENGTEDAEMLQWMKNKLDWLNPITNADDKLLSGVNKKSLKFE